MAAGTKKRPPDTDILYQGGACRWQIRRRRDGAFSDLGAGLHPIGDIGLHLVIGNIQRGGQLTEEQLLRLLHKPLVHHAQTAVLRYCFWWMAIVSSMRLRQLCRRRLVW